MELSIFTKAVYVYIAYRIYGKSNMDFRLVNSKKGKEAIQSFSDLMLERYGTAAGPFFIWFYTIYQFSRFEITGFRPQGFANFCTPTMIYGKSAVEKFGDRKTIDELTIRSPWLQKYKLSQQDFVRETGYTFTETMSKVDLAKVDKKRQQYRDPIKQVTANSAEGMDLCLDMTDLYNDQDPSCQICPYAVECKATLKEVNPKTFALRYE